MAYQGHRNLIVGLSLLIILSMLGCDLSGTRNSKQKSNSNTLNTPEEVVALFCDMDYSGKRLSGLTWNEILPYITWPDEPGWDIVLVVSKYKLSDVKRSDKAADITVEYHVLGKYGTSLLQIDKIEKVHFKVIKTENGWKIKSPDMMLPHVSPMTLITNLEGRLKEEQDSSISNRLRQEIALLKANQTQEQKKN